MSYVKRWSFPSVELCSKDDNSPLRREAAAKSVYVNQRGAGDKIDTKKIMVMVPTYIRLYH